MKVLAALLLTIPSAFFMVWLAALVVGAGERGGQIGLYAGLLSLVAFPVLWARRAASSRQVVRRALLTLAVESFGLPVASLVFTGGQMAQSGSAAGAAGSLLGGGIVTGLLGCVGFVVGVFCLVLYVALRAEPQPQAQPRLQE